MGVDIKEEYRKETHLDPWIKDKIDINYVIWLEKEL